MTTAFEDPQVQRVFAGFPDHARPCLLQLREMIFQVAAQTEGVGKLRETLKWGQPAYLTVEPKSGSTIRLGLPKQGGFALYTHCQTTILSDFQALFPDDFTYEGNRAIHFRPGDSLALDRLALLVKSALTYHLR